MIENDGHLFFDPLPGDVTRTREENPQVTITINNIASRCNGDCSYNWDNALTPTVSAVSPTTGMFLEYSACIPNAITNTQKVYIIV